MLKLFIQRPVLATVISILLVVLGIIGIKLLPVEQYPDIAPPTVRVTTSYNGANADAVQKSVIVPLEEQINGVDNMTYMTSTASNGGASNPNPAGNSTPSGTNPRARLTSCGAPSTTAATESSQRCRISLSCIRKPSAIPPSRARASSLSMAIGSSLRFAEVITSASSRPSANSRCCRGA